MRELAETLALIVMVGILEGGIRAEVGQNWSNESAEVARLRARAERGEAEAQYKLGLALVRSMNVKMDLAQGVAWIQKAAVQEYPDAQYELGQMYQRGQGVPRDQAQAHAWYVKAAQQGHAGAQNDAGVDYYRGWGVPRDDAQALAWFQKAVEQGYPLALHNLARSYFEGRGVPREIVEAYKWQTLAIARANAYQRLAMVETSRQIDQEITPAQVAEAKERAREWTEAFERRRRK
jgi:TPR repeat protein